MWRLARFFRIWCCVLIACGAHLPWLLLGRGGAGPNSQTDRGTTNAFSGPFPHAHIHSTHQANPDFPARGGATGSIRFKNELAHGANAGLAGALNFIAPVAAAHPDVSFADLIQLAGAVAVESTGGPKLAMRYGRKDAAGAASQVKEGNLPAGGAPWPAPSKDAASHLRAIFHRMGMTDGEIVALSGAHTIGRARTSRSGFGVAMTKYTADAAKGTPGGTSWTPEFLTFDNSYFTEVKKAVDGSGDPDLLVLDTDKAIFTDAGFAPYAQKYAKSQDAFFKDYAAAHVKLAELGAVWESTITV